MRQDEIIRVSLTEGKNTMLNAQCWRAKIATLQLAVTEIKRVFRTLSQKLSTFRFMLKMKLIFFVVFHLSLGFLLFLWVKLIIILWHRRFVCVLFGFCYFCEGVYCIYMPVCGECALFCFLFRPILQRDCHSHSGSAVILCNAPIRAVHGWLSSSRKSLGQLTNCYLIGGLNFRHFFSSSFSSFLMVVGRYEEGLARNGMSNAWYEQYTAVGNWKGH